MNDAEIIARTKKWITDVVIGCNFCPFAAKPVKEGTVFFRVEHSAVPAVCVQTLLEEFQRLNTHPAIETTLLVLPGGFSTFSSYLSLVQRANQALAKKKYTGVFQLASFHPEYLFGNSTNDDAANYTNRSPYPMLHLLREASLAQALKHYPNPEAIPERNIRFAREKGLAYMKMLLHGIG